MVRVDVTTVDGLPVRIVSSGHALREGAADSAPCAAVSVVLKSLGIAIAGRSACGIQLDAPEPGAFDLRVSRHDGCGDGEWLHGVWEVTRTSLLEIGAAWPDQVQVRMNGE